MGLGVSEILAGTPLVIPDGAERRSGTCEGSIPLARTLIRAKVRR